MAPSLPKVPLSKQLVNYAKCFNLDIAFSSLLFRYYRSRKIQLNILLEQVKNQPTKIAWQHIIHTIFHTLKRANQREYSKSRQLKKKRGENNITPDTPTTSSPVAVTHNELFQLPNSSLRHLVHPAKNTISIQLRCILTYATNNKNTYHVKQSKTNIIKQYI